MSDQLQTGWLLFRGLSREAEHWGDFPLQLQAIFPQAPIYVMDFPGVGRYFQQVSPDSIDEIMRQTREQLLALKIAWPVNILALSMGAMVAWQWMLMFPNEISRAILVNTSFANVSPFYQRLRWQSYKQFSGLLLEKDVYHRELAIIRLICNNRQNDAKLAEIWSDIQKQRPVTYSNFFKQIKAAASFKPDLTKPVQPLLLLNSQGDRLVSPDCSINISHKYCIELITHPWAGHDLVIDDSEWLLNQLKQWIV